MIQTLTEAHGYAPLELRVDGTHDISGNWSNQTTASEIWLFAESEATLSGEFTIYEGAPPIHINGFNITARIDVEGLAPLDARRWRTCCYPVQEARPATNVRAPA